MKYSGCGLLRLPSTLNACRAVVLAAVLLLTFVGTVPGDAASDIVLKIEHNDRVGSNSDKVLKEVAAELAQRTQGRVKMEIYPSCSLSGGNAMASYQNVQMGAVDGALMYTSLLTTWDPALEVFSLPFMFSSIDALEKVRHTSLYKEILARLESKNLKVIDGWTGCLRQIVNKVREIRTPQDLVGLKLRVPEVTLWTECFKKLGAIPIPLPFSEIPTAMQVGAVQGAERPTEHLFAEKWWEMAKFVTVANYSGDVRAFAFNLQRWNQLPTDVKAALIEVIKQGGDRHYQIEKAGEEEILQTLKDRGMTVTQLTSQERARFKEAMAPVWESAAKRIGPDIVKAMKDLAQD